jgi:hypothetical protein
MTGPSASYRGLLPFRIQSPGFRPSEIGASTDQVPARAAGQKSKLGSFRKPATRFGSLGSFRSTSALDPLQEIGFVSKKPGTGPAGPITFFELASFRRTRRKLPTIGFVRTGIHPAPLAKLASFRQTQRKLPTKRVRFATRGNGRRLRFVSHRYPPRPAARKLGSFRRTRRKLPTGWVRFAPPGLGPSAARFGSFRNRWDMPRDRVPSPDAAAPRAPGFR